MQRSDTRPLGLQLRQVELDSSYDIRSERFDIAVLLLLDHGRDPDGEQRRANESALALALESGEITKREDLQIANGSCLI